MANGTVACGKTYGHDPPHNMHLQGSEIEVPTRLPSYPMEYMKVKLPKICQMPALHSAAANTRSILAHSLSGPCGHCRRRPFRQKADQLLVQSAARLGVFGNLLVAYSMLDRFISNPCVCVCVCVCAAHSVISFCLQSPGKVYATLTFTQVNIPFPCTRRVFTRSFTEAEEEGAHLKRLIAQILTKSLPMELLPMSTCPSLQTYGQPPPVTAIVE